MRGANLVGAMIDYSRLVNVDMTGALTDKPSGKTIDQLPMPFDQMLALHAVWIDTIGAKGQRLDIGGHDMRGAPSMKGANLTMLLADRSVWYAQDLSNAHMQAAHLTYSDLRNCNLESADLRGGNFLKANLTGSKLRHVRLEPLLLNDKRFLKSNFASANLRYTDFTGANLDGVNFTDADLSFADFTGAKIDKSIFDNAVMEEVKIDYERMPSEFTIIKKTEIEKY
jgi:uncharacterized protein YjbI with pentapeptide repeats